MALTARKQTRTPTLSARRISFQPSSLWSRRIAVSGGAGALLMSLLPACGQRTTEVRDSGILPLIESARVPAVYELADGACQTDTANYGLTGTTIFAWDNQAVDTVPVPLNGGDPLQSAAISETTWNDRFERVCDYNRPSGAQCADDAGNERGWDQTSSSGKLRVCKDGHAYGRTTYEGVALTSSYFINAAYDKYRALAEPGAPVTPIRLSVLPTFIDYFDHFPQGNRLYRARTFITHNLAYFPGSTMIVVFPEEKARAATSPGFLWESGFVLAHEYGHHIDAMRHAVQFRAMGLTWNPRTHSFDDEAALTGGNGRDTERAQLQGALAEGFADLLAYYVDGGSGRSLVGLPDLGYNRNVGTTTFSNGDEKILTPDRLKDLLHSRAGSSAGTPLQNELSYADIHTVGAVLAHTVDQFLARLALTDTAITPGSPADINRRYQLALAWMDVVVAAQVRLPDGASGAELLSPLTEAFEAVTQAQLTAFPLTATPDAGDAQLRLAICTDVLARLPALPRPPFPTNGTACS